MKKVMKKVMKKDKNYKFFGALKKMIIYLSIKTLKDLSRYILGDG